MSPANPILRKAAHVRSRKNPDGSVTIIDLKKDEAFYTLDKIAAEFWLSVDGKTNLERIKKRLITKHRPPESAFDRDVAGLIKNLKKEGLIR